MTGALAHIRHRRRSGAAAAARRRVDGSRRRLWLERRVWAWRDVIARRAATDGACCVDARVASIAKAVDIAVGLVVDHIGADVGGVVDVVPIAVAVAAVAEAVTVAVDVVCVAGERGARVDRVERAVTVGVIAAGNAGDERAWVEDAVAAALREDDVLVVAEVYARGLQRVCAGPPSVTKGPGRTACSAEVYARVRVGHTALCGCAEEHLVGAFG